MPAFGKHRAKRYIGLHIAASSSCEDEDIRNRFSPVGSGRALQKRIGAAPLNDPTGFPYPARDT